MRCTRDPGKEILFSFTLGWLSFSTNKNLYVSVINGVYLSKYWDIAFQEDSLLFIININYFFCHYQLDNLASCALYWLDAYAVAV